MKTYDVEQGTPEWFDVRKGIPTASEFHKILTPTGKKSSQANGYMEKLLAEIILGKPVQTFEKTPWMERGNELEQEAADYYELQNDIELVKVGFCTDDAGLYGCSPDRLVGEDGGLEIKVVAPNTQVGYLLSGKFDNDYKPQIQGTLLITRRKWWDWQAYCPEMPVVKFRIERDIPYIMELQAALNEFNKNLNEQKETLKQKGYIL
jgi:hypothetical protein